MEIKRIEGEIEAILFAMGEAVELPRIARAIRQDPTTTENIIRNMSFVQKKNTMILLSGSQRSQRNPR